MANKIVNTFETGLVKVNNKTKQPKNSYSYALNTVPNDEITDRSSRTNERGFDNYITLKEDPYHIIGHQWLGDQQYAFFIKDIEGWSDPFNEIWYVDIKEGIQELRYSNLDLNFKEAYPILSTFRTDYRNHRLIYWVDGLNDDRIIDIDDPDVSTLELSMLSMNSSEVNPDIKIEVVDNAGAVKTGQYFISTSYVDNNNYVTNASNFSKPVSISTDSYQVDVPINSSNTRLFPFTNGSQLDIVSNKRIDITISNIDTRYENLIIYVIQVTDTFTKIFKVEDLRITDDIIEFEFTGLNVPEDTSITINDLVVDKINYYASNIINQKENRLIRGNLKSRETLINYQEIANDIRVTYDIEEELVANPNIYYNWSDSSTNTLPNSVREQLSYASYGITPEYLAHTGNSLEVSTKTFMRDEVYALGISFELTDGTETDVFHIPGRALNTFATTAIGNGEYNRSFNNQSDWDNDIIDGNARWLTRNTAIKRASGENELGYWRSDEVYPDNYGYPTDGEQDGTNKSYIRHHKMPSDVLEPIYRYEANKSNPSVSYLIYKRNLKLVLNNIVIPEEYQDIIVKARIHYVKRNDFNKSIVSKGLIYGTAGFTGSGGLRQSPQFNMFNDISNLTYQFVSPDVDFRFGQFPISAQYFKAGYVARGYVHYFGESDTDNNYRINLVNNYLFHRNNSNPPYTQLLVGTTMYVENAVPIEADYIRSISNIIFTDANSIGTPPDPSLGSSYVFTGESKSSLFAVPISSPGLYITPSNYPSIGYEYSEGSHLLPDVNYDGTSLADHIIEDIYYDSVIYGSLIRVNRNQYGNINNLIYIDTGTSFSVTSGQTIYNEIEVKNGDCVIDVHYTKKGYSVIADGTTLGVRLRDDGDFDQAVPNVRLNTINSYIAYLVETDLNIRMRNSDPQLPEAGFDYFPLDPLASNEIYTSFEKKSTGDEYFNIYPSYNNQALKEFFANDRLLSDFTSITRSNKYENRLVYSDKQSYEDQIDSFRITRANNYKDLPMDRGQITQSFIKDDKFFVLTRDALFNVYASNKTIQSIDNDNIVVGTGEFFGLEPVELISIKGGFGGTSSKYSLSESPYGYLFVDRLKSKTILFNNDLKDINVGGLNEDYTLQMYNQYKELELNDKFDNPIIGPGIISIYDPRLHRYIITKKDYIALDPVTSKYQGLFNPDEVYEIGDIVSKDGVLVEITDIEILPEEKLLFTTSSSAEDTDILMWFNEWSGTIPQSVSLVVKKNNQVIKDEVITIGGGDAFVYDVLESGVSVYVKAEEAAFDLIKEIRIRGNDWDINSIYPSIFPNLTKLNVADQKSLTTVDLSNNLEIDRLEMYNNGLSGLLDISMLDKALSIELFENNLSGISSVTNHPLVTYYNVSQNPSLTSVLDFTSSPNIHTIFAFGCDLSGINITGRTNLFEVGISQNLNLSQAIDLNSCPNIEVFTAEQVPLTNVTWNLLSKVRGFFVAANSIPQSSIQQGIDANKPVLEAVSVISMPQITTPLNFDDCPNLHFLWCTDLNNCTGISWNNSNAINNLSIVGMHALSHTIDITGKTVNEYFGVTGTNITPTNLDDLIIYISGLNVPPLNFDRPNIPGPGTVLYGDYGTAIGTIHPTSASLAAYNDLVSRGYTVVGPVPGT